MKTYRELSEMLREHRQSELMKANGVEDVSQAVDFAWENEVISARRKNLTQDEIAAASYKNFLTNWESYADQYGIPYSEFKAEMQKKFR